MLVWLARPFLTNARGGTSPPPLSALGVYEWSNWSDYMWFSSAAGRSEARNADARGLLLVGRHGDLGIVHSGRSLLPGPPG